VRFAGIACQLLQRSMEATAFEDVWTPSFTKVYKKAKTPEILNNAPDKIQKNGGCVKNCREL
jgi:hypothetical protein